MFAHPLPFFINQTFAEVNNPALPCLKTSRPNAKRGPVSHLSTTIFTRKIVRNSNWSNLNQDQPGSLAEPAQKFSISMPAELA